MVHILDIRIIHMYTIIMAKKESSIFQEIGFTKQSGRVPEAVIYSLARTFNTVSKRLANVYSRFGLTAASFNLLMLLKHGKGRKSFTQRELGSRLVASPSNMTGLIDRLEARQLVSRLNGADRRSKLLQITTKGAKLLDDVWPFHIKAIQELTQSLSDKETQILFSSLSQLRQSAGSE